MVRFYVVVDALWLCYCDSFHPIQSGHFGCADNLQVLYDLIDNIPDIKIIQLITVRNLGGCQYDKHTFIECVDILGAICGRSRYAPVLGLSCSAPGGGCKSK